MSNIAILLSVAIFQGSIALGIAIGCAIELRGRR